MKRVFITLTLALFLSTGIAMAQLTYRAITPDGTITDKALVQVQFVDIGTKTGREKQTIGEGVVTLRSLNTRRAVLVGQRTRDQAEIAEIDVMLPLVQTEVGKVVLKVTTTIP